MKSKIIFLFGFLFFAASIYAQGDLKICPKLYTEGDEIGIEVGVENFEDMVSFQFAIAWSTRDFDFVEVADLNPDLSFFDGSAVSPLLDTLYDNVQMIRFSWYHPVGKSTLDDGQVLFRIKVNPMRDDVSEPNFGVFEDRNFMMEFVDASIDMIPVVIDGEGCNVFSLEEMTSSIKEEIKTTIEIYPNPSKDIVNINFEEPFVGMLTVHNILGEKVHSQNVKRSIRETIAVKQLDAGEYFIHIEDQDGKTKTLPLTVIK